MGFPCQLEELVHAKKTIGVHPNIQSFHVYIHTVSITGVGCSVFRIELCDNFRDSN